KKNDTGTCRICEMCCKRLAPMRFVPLSYFCTCWNVSPRASPSFSWLIPSIIRRIRTRLPTFLSHGLGTFLTFACPRFTCDFGADCAVGSNRFKNDRGTPDQLGLGVRALEGLDYRWHHPS